MKKKIFTGITLFLIATLLGVVVFIFILPKEESLTKSQKEEALTKLLGRKVNLDNKEKTGNQKYTGKFAEFDYPAKAERYNYVDPNFESNSALLESMSYDLRNPRAVFNYEVLSNVVLRLKSIDDYPSVKFRSLEKSYTKKIISADEKIGRLYEKEDNLAFEKTVFFFVGGKIFSFALTGPDEKELGRVLNILISSLKFVDGSN